MITLSNILSFLRAPLAFSFFSEDPSIRLTCIFLAMFTDSIDGYVARRSRQTSRFGAIFDPAMDKFFVYFVLSILLFEQKILLWESVAMVSRDFFLCLFALYLFLTGKYKGYQVKAIRWGKVTTAMQFITILGLTLSFSFSRYLYISFICFGVLAFLELYARSNQLLRAW